MGDYPRLAALLQRLRERLADAPWDKPGIAALYGQLNVPVVPVELPAYQKKENWGAAETFYQLVRALQLEVHNPADDFAAEVAAASGVKQG